MTLSPAVCARVRAGGAVSPPPTVRDDPAPHDVVADDPQVFVPEDPVDPLSPRPVSTVDTRDPVPRDAALLCGPRLPRVASARPSAGDTTPTPTPRPSFWPRVRRCIRSLHTLVI